MEQQGVVAGNFSLCFSLNFLSIFVHISGSIRPITLIGTSVIICFPPAEVEYRWCQFWPKGMTSEVKERPRLITAGYGRHKSQWVKQSRSQWPRSFWLATGIATSGQVQLRKSAIHGLPVTTDMPRVKSDKSDWFRSQSIVFTQPFKTGMSLGLARGPDISSAWQKGPWERGCGLNISKTSMIKAHQACVINVIDVY